MMIRASVIMALRAILGNKLRSSLTILGIVIGIASVIAMLSVGQGVQRYVSSSIQKMGSNLLMVRAGATFQGVVRSATTTSLTLGDAQRLGQQLGDRVTVAPEMTSRIQVKYQAQNTNTTAIGITAGFFAARNYTMEIGTAFSAEQAQSAEKICIIGQTVARTLFSPSDMPVGKTIRINRIPFRIVGVYQEKGESSWQDEDDQILIPIRTMQTRLLGDDNVRTIYISVHHKDDIPAIQAEAESALRRLHRLKERTENDFTIRSQVEIQEAMNDVTRSFTMLLGSIACISLIVGGIGIMNILLVSVTERTREIGIRKAIGAYDADILFQFLIESILLCLMGGVLGIGLGVGASAIIGLFAPWKPVVSGLSIALSVAVSFAVGVFFGFYPARKAARMNPIDALRFE